MPFQHTRRCQSVSPIQLPSTAQCDVQLIAVEQRSRQRRLNVLHSLRLKLVLSLELLRRLTSTTSLALPACSLRSRVATYEFLPPAESHKCQQIPPPSYQVTKHHQSTHAALWPSGTLASTALISPGPKPVAVLLCFGLVMPGGPTAVWKSLMGEETLGLRSLGAAAVVGDSAMILARGKCVFVRK